MNITIKNNKNRTYQTWLSMIYRCYNVDHASYPNYGGRGIKVCDRWKNSFENFIADKGERPEGYSLDRIDNDGNYEPSNCRWSTRLEQANNKRNNRFIEINGKTLTVAQWSDETGIPRSTISRRLNEMNMPPEQALDLYNIEKNQNGDTSENPKYVKNKHTVFVEYAGIKDSVYGWSKSLGISIRTIQQRIDLGYPIKWVLHKGNISKSIKMHIEKEKNDSQ